MFFGRSDHCHQWFYDGFLMLLPSLSMVFDGSGPLVKRCDGFDGSLWSIHDGGGADDEDDEDHFLVTGQSRSILLRSFFPPMPPTA